MANEQMDAGTAYNDMLERVNKMSNEMRILAERVERLEERAAREDSNAQIEQMAEYFGKLHRNGE